MAIGKRIKYIRSLRGLTQKELGEALGFKGKTSDVRNRSGTPAPRTRLRRKDYQDEIRPQRCKSAYPRSRYRQDRDRKSEPRIRGRYQFARRNIPHSRPGQRNGRYS